MGDDGGPLNRHLYAVAELKLQDLQIDSEYIFYLIFWLVAPLFLFMQQSINRQPGFLVFTYLLSFFTIHWFGALAHASPWANFSSSENTIIGFKYSTWSLIAFLGGSLLMDGFARPEKIIYQTPSQRIAKLKEAEEVAKRWLAPAGVIAWLLQFTPLVEVPSFGALLSVGRQSLLLAFCLACWSSWSRRMYGRFWGLLILALVFPLITVSTTGFIGYGIGMTTSILAFIAIFFRPRFALLVSLICMIYGGVSLWAGYAERRSEVRQAAWEERNSFKALDKMVNIISSIEPFDLSNPSHLYALDVRLNQNELVGAAAIATPSVVPYRYGETLWAAALSFIPRAIWPDKPQVGGSGSYVSEHTLIQFGEGTSVGMGQVLEFYINFGFQGVVIGFALLGAALRFGDQIATEAMTNADWERITVVFLIGSGLLQAGGSMMEVVASCGTGLVLYILLKIALKNQMRKNRPHYSSKN